LSFNLAAGETGDFLGPVPKRVKKTRSFLGPVAEDFIKRVSGSDIRLRRRLVRFGFWIIGISSIISLFSGTYGIPRIVRLEMEKKSLIVSNLNKTAALVDAVRIRQRLVSDPKFIESIARSRYYMIYSDETIYRYQGR
jgi:cell division protein FtsB